MNVRALFVPLQGGKPFFAHVPCEEVCCPHGKPWRQVPPKVNVFTKAIPLDASQRSCDYELHTILYPPGAPRPIYVEAVDIEAN